MIRKAIIVALTLCAGVTAYAQFTSHRQWYSYSWRSSSSEVSVAAARGRLVLAHLQYPGPISGRPVLSSVMRQYRGEMHPLRSLLDFEFTWRRPFFGLGSYASVLIMPLWVPLLLFAAYPTIAFIRGPLRRRRRRKRGLCLSCGYDLTGNTSGVCPECAGKVEG